MDEQQEQASTKLALFYSYAREDERLREKLETHLSVLRQQGIIVEWHQGKIVPGTNWSQAINSHLMAAQIILLLISPDFLNSDSCYSVEMYQALERQKLGNALVIPLLLRPVDWQGTPFAHLQCLPRNGKPVTTWRNRDEALAAIVKELRVLIDTFHSPTTSPVHSLAPLPPRFDAVPASQQQPTSLVVLRDLDRQGILDLVRKTWITGVLENSLSGATFLNPGLKSYPAALLNPWENLVQETYQMASLKPSGTSIIQVYDQMPKGALLILGEPGAGKTTLLLQLAHELLQRAECDSHLPIPVIFHLASWMTQRLPLSEWLIQELHEKYVVPLSLCRTWIQQEQLSLLLDGLDEMPLDARSTCLQAISGYHEAHAQVSLIVCSRRAEYLEQPERLRWTEAILIQPFSQHQIEQYLMSASTPGAALRTILHQDEELQVLAVTPLLLNTLLKTYSDMTSIEVSTSGSLSLEKQHSQIFANYVDRMLHHRSKTERYTPDQIRHWLSMLARQMQHQNQSIFYLEHIQSSWLPSQYRSVYDQIAVTLSALLIGLLSCWLLTLIWPGNLAFTSLVRPGILAALLGFIFARRNLVQARSTLSSRGRELQAAILKGSLTAGLLTALVWAWVTNGNFFDRDPHDFQGRLIAGLTTCCAWILISLFIQRVSLRQRRTDPQGIQRISFHSVLMIGIFTGFISTMRSDIAYWWFWQPDAQGPIVGLTYAISEGVMYGILSAFLSVVLDKHDGTISPTEMLRWSILSLLHGLLESHHFRNVSRITLLMIFLECAIFVFFVGRYVDFNMMTQPVGLLYGLVNGVTVGLIFGINYWLFLGLRRGISPYHLDQAQRLLPNQGIRQSCNNGIRIGIITMCLNSSLSMLSVFLQRQMNGGAAPSNSSYLLFVGINAAIASFLLSWLLTGGLAWLQHYFLRCLLWSENIHPLRYVQFLNYAVERELLNKVGGGYIFKHRLLLEYFASLSPF